MAVVTGAGAIWTVTEMGHSGAKATWDDVGPAEGNEDGGEDEGEEDEEEDGS